MTTPPTMIRATPVEMRKALELVEVMKRAGVLFVPMPVITDADRVTLTAQMLVRLEEIERLCNEQEAR